MAIDKREDAGEFYPGGKVVPRTPVTPGGGGGDMYHSEFGDLDPETTPLAVVIERLKGTVNTIAAAICLIGSISACAAVSVVPVYTNHNRVAGNVQTMTNMPAWASAVETAIGEIGGATTNAVIDIVSPMTNAAVEAAVGCATNATKAYADKKFLPKNNPSMANKKIEWWDEGGLRLESVLIADGLMIESIGIGFDSGKLKFVNEATPYSDSSLLLPDNTPVLTANLATNLFVNKSMIAGTDPTFSNAVMNVTMNVSSNEVAAIRAMVGNIGDLPIEGGAATIGGLLMALAAAVAWLKKKKIEKLKCSGVSDITTENGEVDVSSLFSGANTSLVAVCQQYGGTQIKQDEQGNYYYDVED